MKSYLLLRNEKQVELPPDLRAGDLRYPESLVEHFLREYTQEGDAVLDPFAGFGTTLLVAEEMGRIPFGIEIGAAKCEYVRSRLKNKQNLIHGDSRQLASYRLTLFDFSITSPPYMTKDDKEDPFTDYSAAGRGSSQYLQDIRSIYQQVARVMKEGAHVVIEASNLKRNGVTTLAWDIAREVAHELFFVGEVVVGWEPTYGYGYDHSYCLVFRKQAATP